MTKLMIRNVNIVTMNKDKEIIEDGFVIIERDSITYIGSSNETNEHNVSNDYNIIDGKGGILMPGMINTHTHASMIAFRSLADDVQDRLTKYIFPLENIMVDEKLVYSGARYAICEMLLGGVTTFCNSYYFEDEVAKAAKEMSIRAVLGETVVNFVAPDAKEPYEGLKYAERFIEKWKGDDLITPAIAPHAPYTNDSNKLIEAYSLARKHDVPIIMHVAEMDYEQKKYAEEYNMTPVQYLDSLGILDENFIGAHLINVSDEDLDILENKGVGISHNVGSNSKGAKGVAPVVKMFKRGMKLGLGTDGPMSGNTLDIITQMSLVGKIHKLYNMDRTIFPAIEIVEMATIGGARALNIDNVTGSIEVGKKADMVIIETESVNMCPIYDYYSALVYSANPSNVELVIVNGEVLVKDKKLIKNDLMEIKNELLQMKDKILEVSKRL
ncbi:Cytosine/adenosine deaminase [Alkaliphilus peptidifermentans DSM 18978]|uniref:Cytosine/adenosine deaminase n=1 Tax=Alkaliphilus peptidifermentans DSM 18978 TaxID=1120976 RepID=A0A1G5CDY5_9FIRM|nr:Cytosine/adenosine deaminase [Alkaliphilus peptidifermentans DSM 18978]